MSHKEIPAVSRQEFFKLFLDNRELFHMLSVEQVGKLIRAVLKYGRDGTTPTLDAETIMYFMVMKDQIDRDAENYENRCRQNSVNAKKRFVNKTPVKEEVSVYFKEESLHSDPEYFFNYYEARGWCINGSQIADWKALAKTWEKTALKIAKNRKMHHLYWIIFNGG